MLDINLVRNNPDLVKKGIAAKNANPKLVDDFLALDEKWRALTKNFDDLRAEQKKLGEAKKIKEAKTIKEEIQKIETELKQIEIERQEILWKLPNLPLSDVLIGKDESQNVVLREIGEKPKFFAKGGFQPKNYLELAERLDLIDVERAAKVSGSRFGYLKNQAAILEFALVKFVLDNLVPEGFIPIVPPVMIKEEMMKGMGYIDSEKEREERYFLNKDKLYLVGTSEQSIGPMYADEILEEKKLPKRFIAFSTCFRREAGSYGKDTKGILRVHQFDKVEMFSFCHPEKSIEEHQFLLSMEEKLMQLLKIPYRVVQICTGDLGTPVAAKFDIEAWLPGQNRYWETHSTSNCTDFQARRLNIKYKFKTQNLKLKTDYVHTLNGTAFAIGRILIAIIENYQTKKGTIKIPEVLVKYTGFIEVRLP
jgi:seryl-tRNA synthetase